MLTYQTRRSILLLFLLLFGMAFVSAANSESADVGNCLLCHKYPGLSRVDEEGRFRLFYVNEDIFDKSVHTRVKCEDCHTDIKKIPHDTPKKVDCFVQCHIVEPSSEQKFSHKEVAKFLAASVHGEVAKQGNPKKHPEDLPSCKDCHDNPLYRPLSFFKRVRPGISETAMGRCRVCHKKDDFIFRFYNHVTTRLHKIRNPKNIAEVCARCHDDPELVKRHDLSTRAAYSYGETFHGKAAHFLDERIPDCLDCHVKRGESVHQMLSHNDPQSITYKTNKAKICANIECHPKASPKLADYKIHAEFNFEQGTAQYYFKIFFIALTGGVLLPMMGIMFLDVLRRLLPNAGLNRKK
ncbi:MAG: cytochrome C [Deltaproteobacteria bacterium]|nr:MAG: cytochrome C [Deltaproteobacteria bacterium]